MNPEIVSELRAKHLKATVPRVAIFELLKKHRLAHVSAENLYQNLQKSGDAVLMKISLATVYRVLSQLEEVDLVLRYQFDTGFAVYELNDGAHHDHLVCVECGAVSEFVDEEIERRQELVAHKQGFQLTDHRMVLYGVCAECQSIGNE